MSTESNKSIINWLNSRLGLEHLQEMAAKKKVPLHRASLWYYVGGIAMVLMLIQFVTGGLLMIYYIPEISSAHSSILFINSQIDFGWFFRSMHSWGANILIFVVFLHMFSAYFMKAYRGSREITWLTGFALLILCLAFGFTGYLLPWDEIAFFATKIGLDITEQVPFIGMFMAEILRGGEEVGQGTLSRFFVIHVFVLPILLLMLLGTHLFMVQLHGMSEPLSFSSKVNKKYEPFFPNFLMKDLLVWLLVINVMATLVSFMPWGLGPEADAFAPAPAGIKPEWYFLAMFQFLKILPAHMGFIEGEKFGLLVFTVIGAVLAFAPFIDPEEDPIRSRFMEIFAVLVLLAFAGFTIWGVLA